LHKTEWRGALCRSHANLPSNAEMRVPLVLCSLAATLVPYSEGALLGRSRGQHRTGRHHTELPASANVDAALRDRTTKTKFGPGNCISTWRNEDGHCEIKTHCKEQDMSKYAVKFLCIDNGGEKVRHVFAAGSFDEEEQFDTLIECKQCLAEKQEQLEIVDDPKIPNYRKKVKHEEEQDSDENAGAVKMLKKEVKSLEGFMMSTSAELEKLNSKVYSKDFKPKPYVDCKDVGKKAAAKAVSPGAASLVHHKTSHREQGSLVDHPEVLDTRRVQGQALRVQKEHRSELADDDEDVKSLTAATKQVEAVAVSLAGALRGAEEQGQSVPARQPAKVQMLLPKAQETETPKPRRTASFSVKLPQAHHSDDDDDDDEGGVDTTEDEESSSIPQSADDFERQQEEEDERPSMSALQQHGDADGEEETMTDDSDDEEVQEDEDVSE